MDQMLRYFSAEHLNILLNTLKPHLRELQNYHFSFHNPIFGLLLLVFLFMLIKTWGTKKAFSYCLFIATILYLASRLQAHFDAPIEAMGITYADIIRGGSFFVILIVTVYYLLIKNE